MRCQQRCFGLIARGWKSSQHFDNDVHNPLNSRKQLTVRVNKKALVLTSHGQVVMFSPVKFGGYLGPQKLTPVTNALSNKISAKGGIKFRFHKQVHGLMWLPLPKKVILFFWVIALGHGQIFSIQISEQATSKKACETVQIIWPASSKKLVVLQHQQIIIMCFGKLHVVSATLFIKMCYWMVPENTNEQKMV